MYQLYFSAFYTESTVTHSIQFVVLIGSHDFPGVIFYQ